MEERIPASLSGCRDGLKACLNAFSQTSAAIERVILFGSHAQNRARDGSDVDLCIVMSGITSQFEAACRLRAAIGRLRNKPALSLIPISPERLAEKERNHDPFFETILKEGICIAEKD